MAVPGAKGTLPDFARSAIADTRLSSVEDDFNAKSHQTLKLFFAVRKQQTKQTNCTGHNIQGEGQYLSLTLLFEPFSDASVREQYLKASCQTS